MSLSLCAFAPNRCNLYGLGTVAGQLRHARRVHGHRPGARGGKAFGYGKIGVAIHGVHPAFIVGSFAVHGGRKKLVEKNDPSATGHLAGRYPRFDTLQENNRGLLQEGASIIRLKVGWRIVGVVVDRDEATARLEAP
jgi:hypothetical protein